MNTVPHRFARSLVLLAGLTVITAGCAVQFISSYDEQTDKAVTALQKKTETFFVELEGQVGSTECTYSKHKPFYDESKVDVSGIRLRVDAIPQNSITKEQIALLADSLSSLEELHMKKGEKPVGDNCLGVAEIRPLRANFNISFTAILKLELAKKRGEKG